MNKELSDYIVLSRNNKISDEDIKNNLLSKGWTIKEIEETFFILSGGDKSQLKSYLEDFDNLNRKNWFASISLILFILGFIVSLFNSFIPLVILFIGFILGILGIKSKRKKQAIWGIFLNTIMLIIMIITVTYNIYLIYYGKNIFSGEKISDQEIYDMGYTVDELKEMRSQK